MKTGLTNSPATETSPEQDEQRRMLKESAEQSRKISNEIDEMIKKFERYRVTFSDERLRR